MAQDQHSAGGVHHHQVRRTKSGWQARIKQTNGRFTTYGGTLPLSNAAGAAFFETAKRV